MIVSEEGAVEYRQRHEVAMATAGMYCRKCGYDLQGQFGAEQRCPECGRGFDTADTRTFRRRPMGGGWARWMRRVAVGLVAVAIERLIVKRVNQQFLDEVIADLGRGNRVEFRDFGVFTCKHRKARIARNPKTMTRFSVPPKCTVTFKAGRLMKIKIQKSAHPQP